VPGPKNIQPNVSTYNNWVPPFWRQGPRSRCTAPKKKTEVVVVKKKLGSAKIHAGPPQKKKQAPENAQASPPQFLCPQVPQKNPARSERHVQVQKKDAQVKKKYHASFIKWELFMKWRFRHLHETSLHKRGVCKNTPHDIVQQYSYPLSSIKCCSTPGVIFETFVQHGTVYAYEMPFPQSVANPSDLIHSRSDVQLYWLQYITICIKARYVPACAGHIWGHFSLPSLPN
jgi:hypothetical protein